MADNFDQILDECIDRINNGASIESCLTRYPQYASELKPLLASMIEVKQTYDFTPSDEAIRAGRQRFYAALDQQRQGSFWQRLFGKRLVLATVISVIVIMVIGYFGLEMLPNSPLQPTSPAGIVVSAPRADGNFTFLVSDEVNAIGDFSSLNVIIEKVSLQQSGSNKQVEFSPETSQFDLTLLPGDVTQQLWRGDIPEGEYSDITIQVSNVSGVLKSSGETIEIKLPSNKLKMNKPFQVSADNITSFVYDLTAIKAGNGQGNDKYILKPQIDASGASHTPNPNPGKSKGNSPK